MASGSVNLSETSTLNLNAPSGWSGSNTAGAYTGTRIAAPFAILDTLYSTQKAFEGADATLVFPPLKVNWSINNISSSTKNVAIGEIITSHWDGSELYILGKADSDTDEFDAGVIVHEWGHYFEDRLSRSDSIGGSHSSGQIKDITLAFGEAWGNSLAGMMLADHTYRDTYSTRQQTGFSMDLEAGSDTTNPGWFSEASLQLLLYDLFDSADDGSDAVSLGLQPILSVLTGAQKNTEVLTSIFSFITALKSENPAASSAIDALTQGRTIDAVADVYGSGETHDGGDSANLAVYKNITIGGSNLNVTLGGTGNTYNALNNNRYITFTGDGTQRTLSVTTTDQNGNSLPDEDVVMYVYQKGYLGGVDSVAIGTETLTINTVNNAIYTIVIQGYYANTTPYTATVNIN